MSRKLSAIKKNVRRYRKEFGFSQDKLSKLAGVAYNTIIKIESGENSNPTIKTAQKIAKALKISLDELTE